MKVVAKVKKQDMNVLRNKPSDVIKFVKCMRKDKKDLHGGGGMKNKAGRLVKKKDQECVK